MNGSTVFRPSFEMLGFGGLVLVLRSVVIRLSVFRIKALLWSTGGVGGVGIIEEVSFRVGGVVAEYINIEYRVVEEPSPLLLLLGCLMKEWPLGRCAVSVNWLQVSRKINKRMMIFVAAMFDGDGKGECSLDLLCK